MAFLDPIFALKMYKMGILADQAGYVYLFLFIGYSFFGFLGGVLESIATKRNLIICGYFAGFIGYWLIAHYAFIGQNYTILIIIGLFINGYSVIGGNTFATIYIKEELMKAGEIKGMNRKDIGGYFGGLKGSMNLVGTLTGSFISPNLYILVGFEYACILLGWVQLGFSYVFVIYTRDENNGKVEKQIEQEMYEKLKW
jgi:hypothetical protein